MNSPRSSALLHGAPAEHHVLTLLTTHPMSTAVQREDGGFDVEHPAVVERLCATVSSKRQAAVILRSFTDEVSHTLPSGHPVPVKHVCGWAVHDGEFQPLDEGEMFSAHCTDASTGEPIPPERGVVYTGAWPVDLVAFREFPPGLTSNS